jgi:hypothetical protein
MRFGGADVVFRPLTNAIEVVTIAAAWDRARRKEGLADLVDIASRIGADMQKDRAADA